VILSLRGDELNEVIPAWCFFGSVTMAMEYTSDLNHWKSPRGLWGVGRLANYFLLIVCQLIWCIRDDAEGVSRATKRPSQKQKNILYRMSPPQITITLLIHVGIRGAGSDMTRWHSFGLKIGRSWVQIPAKDGLGKTTDLTFLILPWMGGKIVQ
jgi:hypothetical protein